MDRKHPNPNIACRSRKRQLQRTRIRIRGARKPVNSLCFAAGRFTCETPSGLNPDALKAILGCWAVGFPDAMPERKSDVSLFEREVDSGWNLWLPNCDFNPGEHHRRTWNIDHQPSLFGRVPVSAFGRLECQRGNVAV